MRRKGLFILALVFAFSAIASGQTKTITNADLAKFKQKRLKAEKELRENYREMGFPSPEELARQNEQSRRELSELSQRLREERLARESNAGNRNDRSDSGVLYSDSTGYSDSGFTQYQTYNPRTYTYIPRYGNSGFRYNGYRRNNGRGVIKFRGYIGPNRSNRPANSRSTTFGPSRRLTRQNQRKSRQSDIRNFGPGISITPKRN